MMDFIQTWNLSLGESKEDIGGENPPRPPSSPKLYFRGKGGGYPKLGKNSTNSDLILGKKEGGTTPNQAKI